MAIDASRNRSGGARAHLLGILKAGDPRIRGIAAIHVWSYKQLLDAIPDAPWLIKHSPPELDKSLFRQIWWQYKKFSREIRDAGCDILLSTGAGTFCQFSPSIVMSRDMLSFEGKEMQRYSLFSFARWRLQLLKHLQISSMRRAAAVIFLTKYASTTIQKFTGNLKKFVVIPHGIGEEFRARPSLLIGESQEGIRCLYVSNTDLYKHQWHVVGAVSRLRKAGYPIFLDLVGGGLGRGRVLLDKAISAEDPEGEFVKLFDSAPHAKIPYYLKKANIFIFASSCENMPNTLVEAMAAGLPIACSDRGPMPEILQDAGLYFDPENEESIRVAIEKMISSDSLRNSLAKKAEYLSKQYSWTRCAAETWGFIFEVGRAVKKTVP
ncbi:glycosyltransferase family 4 protein [Variovorax paradoxus]|uniref:glycosyltransferase family 4 protein n=1 Tax=Variovorax paradoxus TaxID=34073 RepID=UPI001D179064|nr:glycosyltransferase family 1 protein [Variovorax paradoxus]